MDQPPNNHNVGVGEHALSSSSSSSSQTFHAPASSGERSPGAAWKRPQKPVTSEGGSEEFQAPDQASPTTNGVTIDSLPTRTHPPMVLPEPTPAADQELMHNTHFLIEHVMDPGGPEVAVCFLHAAEQPPITPESLAELDMPRIINNPKLRHDVNFDRELHFRPNLDGSKGREKVRLAEQYWKALEGELFLLGLVHQHRRDPLQAQNEAYWQGILGFSQIRLPKLFHAIRDILKTLVPDCDQKSIVDRVDVELIMQEIQNGVCDLIDLGNWLAKVLKNHCAPMRDHLVDSMQIEIKRGASEEKPGRLVNGIRQLLTILESMKLDVANHQIRHMRPLLIEDTINFQRRYNAHRISMNKIDVPRSRLWLERELTHLQYATKSPTHVEALTSALLKSLVFNENPYPQTFYLDADRLRSLRVDLQSMVCLSICKEVLAEMAGTQVSKPELMKASIHLHSTISAIVGFSGRYQDRVENIAAEIMRIVLMLEKKEYSFDSTLLGFAQERLENDLHPASVVFEKHSQDLADRILPKLQASVEQNVKLTALHLQDRLVPPVSLPPQPLGFGAVCAPGIALPNIDPDEELVRRFTHIIVLHWQVWADLVYTAAPDDSNDPFSQDGSQTPPSSGSSSPMVPVAQAVYAPGRKWLPIGVTVTEVPSGLPTPSPSPGPEAQSPPPSNSTTNSEQSDSSTSNSQIDPEQQPSA